MGGVNEYVQSRWCLKRLIYSTIGVIASMTMMKCFMSPGLGFIRAIPILGPIIGTMIYMPGPGQMALMSAQQTISKKLGVQEALCHVAGIDANERADAPTERQILEDQNQKLKDDKMLTESNLEQLKHHEEE